MLLPGTSCWLAGEQHGILMSCWRRQSARALADRPAVSFSAFGQFCVSSALHTCIIIIPVPQNQCLPLLSPIGNIMGTRADRRSRAPNGASPLHLVFRSGTDPDASCFFSIDICSGAHLVTAPIGMTSIFAPGPSLLR